MEGGIGEAEPERMGEMKVIVYRKGEVTWDFEPHPAYHRMCHITNRGTVYGIMFHQSVGIYISRLVDKTADKWVSCEKDLKVLSIEWTGAGRYIFMTDHRWVK